MKDLVQVIGLEPIFVEKGIAGPYDDFEALYSGLLSSDDQRDLLQELERAVYDYFAALRLPDGPTLYDHLVLSLRPKDVIASFNWDPLLWQALCRNAEFARGPSVLYLHGNVAVGYCTNHEPATLTSWGARCSSCDERAKPSRLLYPVNQKRYTDDPGIAACWRALARYLEDAFLLTIFGYCAPTTDAEAVDLMKQAWGDPKRRELEQIEIIDIRKKKDLFDSWRPFICSHHYHVVSDFYDSMIARHPRRSVDAKISTYILGEPPTDRRLPERADWETLRTFFRPLLDQEEPALAREPRRAKIENGLQV
jgi:hypothetical protein